MPSDSPTLTETTTPPISLIERYALPYYLPTFQLVMIWLIYHQTAEPAYTSAYALLFPFLGKLLPPDNYPIFNSKQHNQNIFQVFPLVTHILFTWITLALVFIYFPFG